jgi:pheromone shutdown protein TraB
MKRARLVASLLVALALPAATAGESPPSFQPRTTTVLGTELARTPIPFTQVITQRAGELSFVDLEEHFINLVPNWPMLAKALLRERHPVIAHTTAVWADQVLRVVCWIDRANSDLARGHLRIVMEVTEGTSGSTPVGTVFAITDSHLVRQSGLLALKTHVPVTPGILPDVLPTSMTMTTQLVPDFWKTGKPGRVSLVYTFTSVQPPDGSPPVVHSAREDIPVQ